MTKNHIWGQGETKFFYQLDPMAILTAIDRLGLGTSGQIFQLNSLENRVFEIGVDRYEPAQHIIAKFYRPGRWSEEQIREEHQFLFDLEENEIPVIVPLRFHQESLFYDEGLGLYYTLFPKVGGRAPEEMTVDQLLQLGRLLGRLHLTGRRRPFQHRLNLDLETYGLKNLEQIQLAKHLPLEFETRYFDLIKKICGHGEKLFQGIQTQRLHGDCHKGNLLWTTQGLMLLDFDDAVTGPCVQDLWTIIPGRDAEAVQDRAMVIEGYEEFSSFNPKEYALIEVLRALRLIHFAAWVGKRWEDPAFPKYFPYFGTAEYWQQQIGLLHEQNQLIEEKMATGLSMFTGGGNQSSDD